MTISTIKHHIENVNNFITHSISELITSFIFVGRHVEWDDDNNPPDAGSSFNELELELYNHLVYGKRVTSSDVKHAIRKITWTNGKQFAKYDQSDQDLFNKDFYCINSNRDVYKCIDNNFDSYSVYEPTLKSTDIFELPDGYKWKYMFTIGSSDNTKFTTNDYIPVTPNTAIEAAAVSGAIESIEVVNSGSNYRTYLSGYLDSVANSTVVILPPSASSNSNFYVGSSIYFTTGLGSGQIRNIISYDGATKAAVLDETLDFYINLGLSNISSTSLAFQIGHTARQSTKNISYTNKSGYFQSGDNITQTDTLATGTILQANSTVFKVKPSSATDFSLTYPISKDTDNGVQKTGTVSITTSQSNVIGTGTSFNTEYSVDGYIRVGNTALTNIRRILSITNSTHMTVNTAWGATLATANHYLMSDVIVPTSIGSKTANGTIVYSNLTGIQLNYDQATATGIFNLGEKVNQVDAANTLQGANGVVAYANNTTLILSDVGGTWVAGSNLYVKGVTSASRAFIDAVVSKPNITITANTNDYVVGFFTDSYNLTTLVGNATIDYASQYPSSYSQFVISPKVTITGDGSNAAGYSVVNATSNTIHSIILTNKGTGYTEANVTLTANSLYGQDANLYPLIGPLEGHGSDPVLELGARQAIISVNFSNTTSESYKLPVSGDYRIVGLIKNPLYNDVYLNLTGYQRKKYTLANRSGAFTVGEVVFQDSSNAAGVVVYSNSTYLELQNVSNTFTANAAGDNILGLSSGQTANVKTSNTIVFTLSSSNTTITQPETGATGTLYQVVSDNVIRLTSVTGNFATGYPVEYLTGGTVNAIANVSTIKIYGNSKDVSSNLGLRFNNTGRLSLYSNTIAFENNENIEQNVTGATARILSVNTDIDLQITSPTDTYVIGDVVVDTVTSANGIVIGANSTYLKLTSVHGTFGINNITCVRNANATISAIYPVLVISNVKETFEIGNNYFTGANSGAIGYVQAANTYTPPDLVRNSGQVLYLQNLEPFTKTETSKETFKLVIKF